MNQHRDITSVKVNKVIKAFTVSRVGDNHSRDEITIIISWKLCLRSAQAIEIEQNFSFVYVKNDLKILCGNFWFQDHSQ